MTTPLESDRAFLFERLVHTFQSLRAAEIAALNSYPLQAYTILRNVSDNCTLAAAARQGLTNFERLEGILPDEPVDAQKAKKNRKNEEYGRHVDLGRPRGSRTRSHHRVARQARRHSIR